MKLVLQWKYHLLQFQQVLKTRLLSGSDILSSTYTSVLTDNKIKNMTKQKINAKITNISRQTVNTKLELEYIDRR